VEHNTSGIDYATKAGNCIVLASSLEPLNRFGQKGILRLLSVTFQCFRMNSRAHLVGNFARNCGKSLQAD
jgi:hypothetical protein